MAPKKADKGKKEIKKKEGRKVNTYYTVSGETVTRKKKSCPKCGSGTFMGQHKDRSVCGKCAYVEMSKKEELESKKEEQESKKEEKSE